MKCLRRNTGRVKFYSSLGKRDLGDASLKDLCSVLWGLSIGWLTTRKTLNNINLVQRALFSCRTIHSSDYFRPTVTLWSITAHRGRLASEENHLNGLDRAIQLSSFEVRDSRCGGCRTPKPTTDHELMILFLVYQLDFDCCACSLAVCVFFFPPDDFNVMAPGELWVKSSPVASLAGARLPLRSRHRQRFTVSKGVVPQHRSTFSLSTYSQITCDHLCLVAPTAAYRRKTDMSQLQVETLGVNEQTLLFTGTNGITLPLSFRPPNLIA